MKVDKRDLIELVEQVEANLHEIASKNLADTSDYLASRIVFTEKKVLESINKLNIVRDQVMKTPVSSSPAIVEITPAGELLSQHLRQTMMSRCQIETEFMKKKIHFVSEFKLYNTKSVALEPTEVTQQH